MNKLSVFTALALAAAMPWQAVAQSTSSKDKLEEIIVTSSRVPMPLREIGTSVSVITEEEISQLGFNSLYDILRTQPGVAVSNAGGAGSPTSLRIRGEEGYRTLMLLDGIDISDTSSPQVGPRIEQLLSSGVQRVEILRGPQGLLYGADAGGVVNITTIAPRDGLGGEVSAEGGRYGTQQFAGNVGGGNDTVDFNLSAADYRNRRIQRAHRRQYARRMTTVTTTPLRTVASAGTPATIYAWVWRSTILTPPTTMTSATTRISNALIAARMITNSRPGALRVTMNSVVSITSCSTATAIQTAISIRTVYPASSPRALWNAAATWAALPAATH